MAITTVFFDVGNTLMRPALSEAKIVLDAAKSLNISIDPQLLRQKGAAIVQNYNKVFMPDSPLWAHQESAARVYRSAFEQLCESVGIPEHASQLAELSFARLMQSDAWTFFDDVAATLEGLQARGIKMGLISNWDCSLEGIMRGKECSKYFDVIIASAAVGFYKPQREIFELAMTQIGSSPEQSIHVGDNLNADIAGAAGAGITPILIDRDNNHAVDETVIKIRKLTHMLDYVA